LSSVNFIDMCAVCKQGVAKEHMVYKKGRVFHERCFETHGSSFPVIDQEIAQLSAKTRVELVQMKNLKARSDAGLLLPPKAKKKSSAKPKKKTKKSIKSKKAKRSKAKQAKKSKKQASKRRR
jgi:hypothetical protein